MEEEESGLIDHETADDYRLKLMNYTHQSVAQLFNDVLCAKAVKEFKDEYYTPLLDQFNNANVVIEELKRKREEDAAEHARQLEAVKKKAKKQLSEALGTLLMSSLEKVAPAIREGDAAGENMESLSKGLLVVAANTVASSIEKRDDTASDKHNNVKGGRERSLPTPMPRSLRP